MQWESIRRGWILINLSSLILQRKYAGYILRTTYHVMTDGVKTALFQRICLNLKLKLMITGNAEKLKTLDR